ncbi:MAG TPA: glucose-1-phosphate thymidylyltransferase RfbA [Candidatus Omnitrophota bacterium]|nr:glucose-1-phosphate thymidylyltransferase RfbA [Candidatus Omnitrophota bacterium]HPT07760.1 glucose-1-phosphate thymidylyltransferase RfbA [Candidatus Omnitrophota bacterium]
MKGIILAGGKATRLYPITKAVCKQLLPVYDKPMVYYPLSVLMLAGIRQILIISTPQDINRFKDLLGTGKDLGISLSYAIQKKPNGIAESFIVGERFIGKDTVSLILGDNIFYGTKLSDMLLEAASLQSGATVFGYYVRNPQRYGVIDFDTNCRVSSIEEKPAKPQSNWAITGLYFYDNDVIRIAKKLKPSARGEKEITDVNKHYLAKGKLTVKLLERGYAWLDTGTYDSLIDAATFIRTIQDRQGLKIGCLEEIAFRKGFISKKELLGLAKKTTPSYGQYLKEISNGA